MYTCNLFIPCYKYTVLHVYSTCGIVTKLTVAVFILNEHVVVLSPGRVVAYQVRMGAKYCMCTHLTEGCSSEERRKREGRR